MGIPSVTVSVSDFFVFSIGALLLLWLAASAVRTLDWLWWTPRRLERILREQGIRGSSYRLLVGDLQETFSSKQGDDLPEHKLPHSHDVAQRIAPFYVDLLRDYGKNPLTWFGPYPRVILQDPGMVQEVLSTKFGHVTKPKAVPIEKFLVGGLVAHEGEKWVQHRKIINPAFHFEKLKRMLPAFSACCNDLIERWKEMIDSKDFTDVDVCIELRKFSADAISRTAFGGNYEEAKDVFQSQDERLELCLKAFKKFIIPGYSFLPTRDNRRRSEINRETRAVLSAIVEKRKKEIKTGITRDDLLSYLLESNMHHMQDIQNPKKNGMTTDEMIEECKLIYLAGHDTSSLLLTWTMILLSMHPNWQDLARQEVLRVFGTNEPDFDGLSRLTTVTSILYEALRLYPPTFFNVRYTCKEIKIGKFTFPPGVELYLPVLLLHHDPDYWGQDADEFRPERFQEGIAKATKNQMIFFPFSAGPRICPGQNFALLQSKLCLAKILQNFSFELSPSYVHAPTSIMNLRPQFGAPMVLHKL